MLISDRHCRRGVAEPGHELGQRGARLSGENSTGVPEIVKAEIVPTGCAARPIEDLVQGRGSEVVTAAGRGKEQVVSVRSGVPGEVLRDEGHQVRWNSDVAHASIALRRAAERLAARPDDRPPDLDPTFLAIDVTTAKLGK